jgi:hypothetical protein
VGAKDGAPENQKGSSRSLTSIRAKRGWVRDDSKVERRTRLGGSRQPASSAPTIRMTIWKEGPSPPSRSTCSYALVAADRAGFPSLVRAGGMTTQKQKPNSRFLVVTINNCIGACSERQDQKPQTS